MNAIVRQPWLLGGKRGVQGASLDLGFMSPGTLDPRITFTRASTATYFDNTGTLQTAATNLILQSSDASNATWLKAGAVVVAPIVTGNQTTAPDGTLTASRAVYPAVVGTNALSVVYQNIALPTGVYTFTAYLKGNVGGERVWLSVAGWGSGPVATLTTQWQRFTFVTPTLPTATFGFQIGVDLRDGAQTSTSAQTIFIWGTQVEVGSLASFYTPTTTVANGAPRWDYNPSTHALNGLLIEEARTNLLLNSSNFGIAPWSVTAATVAGSAGTAPDGTNSLTLLSETSTTAGHYLAAGVLTVASTQYSLSIFVKAAGVRYLHTVLDDGVVTGGYATFDLQTGTVSQIMTAIGAGVLGVASIQLISNGIYRCTIVTSIGTGVNARILFMCSNTGTPSAYPSYAGNAANGLLIWGAQIEAGAFPTSYIPTTAASVTRAADNASMPTAAWFNAGVGTLATEFIMRTVPATQNTEFVGVGTNSAILVRGFVPGTLANATLHMFNGGGALLAVSTANNVTLGTTSKSAFTYNTTSLVGTIALNGGAVASGTASGAFGGFTTVFIGGSGATRGLPLNGTLSRVRYWPRALSNTELRQVTT